MARKLTKQQEVVNETNDDVTSNVNETLESLIERFGKNNEEVKALKKETDEDGTKIKELMLKASLNNVITDNFKAVFSISKSESFDEEKLIAQLKMLNVTDVIKTREYVDMDALENAIYNGKINASNLSGCKVIKETPRLVTKSNSKK